MKRGTTMPYRPVWLGVFKVLPEARSGPFMLRFDPLVW
jgi:hypothetical protein